MIENPVFLSVSGSHLYQIPAPDDIDIRGAHYVTEERFYQMARSIKAKAVVEKEIAPKIDFVSTEIGRFLTEMTKPNVNFIEQVLSPLSIVRGKYYTQLQELARDCISKACYAHWKGFAKHTTYHAVQEDYKKPKRNLYLLRIYYQGILVAREKRFRSDFGAYKELDCYNDSLVTELFECKKNKTDFFNKQAFLAHCGELEKLLQEEIEKSDLRDAVTDKTRTEAFWLFQTIYKNEVL